MIKGKLKKRGGGIKNYCIFFNLIDIEVKRNRKKNWIRDNI